MFEESLRRTLSLTLYGRFLDHGTEQGYNTSLDWWYITSSVRRLLIGIGKFFLSVVSVLLLYVGCRILTAVRTMIDVGKVRGVFFI